MPNGRIILQNCDMSVGGTLTAETNVPSDGTVTDAKFSPDPDNALTAPKQEHNQMYNWCQEASADAFTEKRLLFQALGDGTLTSFIVGCSVVASGGGNAVVRLLKNGSAILTASITLSSSTPAYVPVSGTFSSAAFVANDYFEVEVVTVTATKPKGLYAQLTVDRDYA